MDWRKHFLEAATLIIAAVVCALVSNAVASRERKLTLVSSPPAPPPAPRVAVGVPPRVAAGVPPRVAAGVPPAGPAETPAPTPVTTEPPATVNQQPATKKPRQPDNPTTRQPIDRFQPHPDKPYIEIHGDDVARLHSKGALFLDARRTAVYEQGHIPGARPFSVWESDIDDKVNKLFAERSDPRQQEQPIVIYCSGGDCEDSHMLAQKLWGIQFNNIYVYKDGFPDWQKRGGPIHSGANP
jgi:rhodanese-related sulfurtransferase